MRILNSFIDAYSSVWYGILVAVIVVALLFFGIAAMQGGNKRFSPLTYVLGVALIAFLSFQFTFMIGAIMFKSDCSDISSIINDFIPNSELTKSTSELRSNLKQLAKEEPFIKNFIDIDDIDESLPDGAFGDAILSKVHSYLNWYIVRRILWSLFAIGILGTLMFISMERNRLHHSASGRRNASAGQGRRHSRR